MSTSVASESPRPSAELSEMINQLSKHNQISPLLSANADYVRILGNLGAHPKKAPGSTLPQGNSVEEVHAAVRQLIPILQWYIEARQSGDLDSSSAGGP